MYVLGGPIIHGAHGHGGKAVLSLAIRGAGPLMIAAGVGSFHSGSGETTGGAVGLAVLGVLAIPAAIAVDAAAIAREDVPREGSASLATRVGVSPWIDPGHRSAGLSIGLGL